MNHGGVSHGGSPSAGYPLPTYPTPHIPQPHGQYPLGNSPDRSYRAPKFERQASNGYPNQSSYQINHQRTTPHNGPYNATIPPQPNHAGPPYSSKPQQGYQNANLGQTQFMGPPIRMGFEGNQASHSSGPPAHSLNRQSSPTGNGLNSFPGNSFGKGMPQSNWAGRERRKSQGSYNGGESQLQNEKKRTHNAAFINPDSTRPRPLAPPAVPEFGFNHSTQPQHSIDAPTAPNQKRKKKRRHNQLGLTPKVEEHESSEEEDDVDEEAKLAAITGSSQQLQFTYKGRTSTLGTSTDIAAWIEERKKRFPTRERIEDRKKESEARKAEVQKQREEVFQQRQAAKEKMDRERQVSVVKNEPAKEDQVVNTAPPGVKDATAKFRAKAEKLRKKLEKEERRIARAESKASAQIGLSKADAPDQNPVSTLSRDRTTENKKDQNEDSLHNYRTEPSEGISLDTLIAQQAALPDEPRIIMPTPPTEGSPVEHSLHESDQHIDVKKSSNNDKEVAITSLASSSSVHEDETSSSGSSLDSDLDSGSGSDSDSASDSAPDEITAKRTAPERVDPPKRAKKPALCKAFVQSGRCRFGEKCRYKHELPERGAGSKSEKDGQKAPQERGVRKGLYQVVSFGSCALEFLMF